MPPARRKVGARLTGAEKVTVAAPRPTHYDLVSMVEHEGATPDAGHYKCHALVDGRWRTFDDSTATVLRSSVSAVAERAYLLFYARRDP